MAEQHPQINQQPIRDRFNLALSELRILHSSLDALHLFTIDFSDAERGSLIDLESNLQRRLRCVKCALRLIKAMDAPAQARDQDISKTLLDTSERVSSVMDGYERSKNKGMPYSIERLTGDLCDAVRASDDEQAAK